MRTADIIPGETYAVYLNRDRKQDILDHDLYHDSADDTDDPLAGTGWGRREQRWFQVADAALDYGRYLDSDDLPTEPGHYYSSFLHPKTRFACGLVVATRQPYGKTRVGVGVRVALFDWWSYWRWFLAQRRDSVEDVPAEVLAEVHMAPGHVTLLVNASQLVTPWAQLPEWRLRESIEAHERVEQWRAERGQR